DQPAVRGTHPRTFGVPAVGVLLLPTGTEQVPQQATDPLTPATTGAIRPLRLGTHVQQHHHPPPSLRWIIRDRRKSRSAAASQRRVTQVPQHPHPPPSLRGIIRDSRKGRAAAASQRRNASPAAPAVSPPFEANSLTCARSRCSCRRTATSSTWNPASRSSADRAPAGTTPATAASNAARAAYPAGVIPAAAAPARIWSRSSVDSLTCKM